MTALQEIAIAATEKTDRDFEAWLRAKATDDTGSIYSAVFSAYLSTGLSERWITDHLPEGYEQ